jgi:hypothetical protein
MQIIDCEQGTESWAVARRGIPSASNFDKIITTKGEPSKQALKYMYKLAIERISGQSEDTFQSMAMSRGVAMESEARSLYEFLTGQSVTQTGFIFDERGWGCSPDGLVDDEGLIEIKCPLASTHVEYLLDGKLPTEYFQQCQGELFITGRKWLDFISYYPAVRPLLFRVYPDVEFHKKLQIELELFVSELNQLIKKIN